MKPGDVERRPDEGDEEVRAGDFLVDDGSVRLTAADASRIDECFVFSEAKGIANRVGREQRVGPLIRDEDVHAGDLALAVRQEECRPQVMAVDKATSSRSASTSDSEWHSSEMSLARPDSAMS